MEINSVENLDISEFGVLRHVLYDVDEDCNNDITEVVFVFDKISLRITVNIDEDTVCLSALDTHIEMVTSKIKKPSFDRLIPCLVSKSVLWVWELVNQQGYRDGLQFEFVDMANQKNSTTVQFIAIASGIRISTLEMIA